MNIPKAIPRVKSPEVQCLESHKRFWRDLAKEVAEATAAYLDCPDGEGMGAGGQTLRNLRALLLQGVKAAVAEVEKALENSEED